MSGKVKTRPMLAPKRQRLRKRNDKGQEEMEMKGMAEPDDDYYFEDPSNIGTYIHPLIVRPPIGSYSGAVTGRNDIAMADFPAHVRQMHLDGDWKLELEYKVYQNNIIAVPIHAYACLFVQTLEKVSKPASDVGRLACNLPHNRFKNIFPCE